MGEMATTTHRFRQIDRKIEKDTHTHTLTDILRPPTAHTESQLRARRAPACANWLPLRKLNRHGVAKKQMPYPKQMLVIYVSQMPRTIMWGNVELSHAFPVVTGARHRRTSSATFQKILVYRAALNTWNQGVQIA